MSWSLTITSRPMTWPPILGGRSSASGLSRPRHSQHDQLSAVSRAASRGRVEFLLHLATCFRPVAAAIGTIFAAYCSLALITDALGDEVDPRRMARVQREIGVASGILMATGKLSADEAFAELYRASQRLHRDLPEVARHVTATGRLPDESDDLRPQG